MMERERVEGERRRRDGGSEKSRQGRQKRETWESEEIEKEKKDGRRYKKRKIEVYDCE